MNGMKEVSREELITVEEESAFIKQIQQSPYDSDAAKERLLLTNRRFVRAIAKKKFAAGSYPIEELIA